jgi:hypothetical protein
VYAKLEYKKDTKGTDPLLKWWLFRTKDYIRREGYKEGCFYIRKMVLFIEGIVIIPPIQDVCWYLFIAEYPNIWVFRQGNTTS